MPAQRVREMHALRGASAEGMPDTTKFHTTEKDRLTGDTIVAQFDTIPAKDTSSKPRMKLLVATGHATSLQHLPPRDTTLRLPAINYVRGRLITVAFDSAKVKNVVVRDPDQSGGVYIEPNPDSTRTRPATVAGTGTPASPPPVRTPASTPVPVTPAQSTVPPPRRP
jgi:hypothetical protein